MTSKIRRSAITGARHKWQLAGLVLAALVACGDDDGPRRCEDGARTYDSGEQWTCSDGCNGCSCDDGAVTSTAIACVGPPGEAAGKLSCADDGRVHAHGMSWPCACGTCTCEDGRKVSTGNALCGAAGTGQ